MNSFVPGINQYNDPLNDKFLKLVVDSALRHLPLRARKKTPLSGEFVSKLLDEADRLSALVDIRDRLIISLSYTFLLRHDEIAHISCSHLAIVSGGVKIAIPSSKTDVYKHGNHVLLSQGRVLSLLRQYMSLAGLAIGDNHFLFGPIIRQGNRDCVQNNKLSYTSYWKILKSVLTAHGYDAKLYGFHSCRSGGASSLAGHVTKYELLNAGRWKSARSLSHYVKIPDKRKMQFSELLSG